MTTSGNHTVGQDTRQNSKDGFGKTLAIQEHGMFDMMDRSSNTHSSSLHSGNAGCWGGLRTARSTWPVASRIQAEGMKGHGLARGSDARQQVSGIWFAVEGDKPWRSATCISARPEQEVIAAVLSPNIDGSVGVRRVIVNVRVRHAGGHGHRFMAQKNSKSPRRGECNKSIFFSPSPPLDGSCYSHTPISRPIGD
ncbi:hypothetical protein QR685DRAFT_575249 [Neurospora intermedia]|uniref:Questionable protein n=1 Tax=Neurospora intermedia TaxID=5142 RepID=A0ABR3D4I8_NEUIN